ncbi:MAG: hypothetical protein ABW034_20980 [Steroidobacteraceae bacterium]
MSTSWKEELPVEQLPDDPSWRENFCFDGYDHRRDIGFWIHCSRWPYDRGIWREQVLVYWPGTTYLVHRAWGYRPNPRGVSSALLDLLCTTPGEAWTLKYRGPTRPTTDAELRRGPLPEAPQSSMDLNIEFTSTVPMWDMTAGIDGEDWGKFHIEQTGRFKGTIRYGDETVAMDGFGWHDHSRGPRHVGSMGRHCWIHGNLSRGRSFAMTVMDNLSPNGFVRGLDKIVIWDGGRIHAATCPNPPFLESSNAPSSSYSMQLVYAGGTIDIEAQTRRCLPHSTTDTMEIFDGVTPGIAHVVTYEQGSVFKVDGELHDGHTERSYLLPRVDAYTEPPQ